MTNDSENGNGLQYGSLKKITGCQFFKVSRMALKSLKFCKTFVAVWNFTLFVAYFILFHVVNSLSSGSPRVRTTRGEVCVFPFRYRGRRYNSCTRVKSRRPWCALTPSYDVDKLYGYCRGRGGEE